MDWKTLIIWLISAMMCKGILCAPQSGASKDPILPLKTSSIKTKASSATPAPKGQGQKCCENGGLCVLGSFCHCPSNYYGYRCEFAMNACGPVAHGLWARVGCHLCRCFDGNLMCLYQVYSGCDDQEPPEKIDINDFLDELKIFPPDESSTHPSMPYDDYYYEYDYGDEKKKTNSVATLRYSAVGISLPLLLLTVFIHTGLS